MEGNVLLSMLMFASAAMLAVLGLWCFMHKNVRGARAYSLLVLAMFLHTTGYSFELLGRTMEGMYACIRIEYIGISFYPFLFLLFTSEYADERRIANNFVRGVFLIADIMTLFLVNTNRFHHMYYSHVGIDLSHGFPVLDLGIGPWYAVQGVLLFLAAAYSTGVYIFRIVKLDHRAKRRAAVLLIGTLVPCVTSLFYLGELLPKHIDFLPLSYLLMTVINMVGLFRHQLFRVSELTHEMILDTIEEAVMVVSEDDTVVNVSKAARRYFEPLSSLKTGDSLSGYPEIRKLMAGEVRQEFDKEGRSFQLQVLEHRKQRCSVLVFSEITEEVKAKRELERLASTDYLTGLFNRRHFLEEGEKEITKACRYEYPVSMILLDIDHFKETNDVYGHHAGDMALCHLSGICRMNIRQVDLLARYGGEEFIILLPHVDLSAAGELAERLRVSVMNRAMGWDSSTIRFTISLGVSGLRQTSRRTLDEMILLSDKALYYSKETGRNRTTISGT